MSSTLNPDQHVSLKILEGETSSILTTAVIKLFIFHAKDERWLYTGLSGALCLVIDRKLKGAVLFRLYDLNLYDIVFEQEVYYEFLHLYQEINEQFFCFPVIGNFVFGFSFAEINEAINFKLKITQYCPVKEKKINEDVINISKSGKLTKERSLSPNEMEIIKGKLEKPTNFKHLNHISWNAITKTFDFSQLSKEFKTIFKNAGIKKKEMKNTETALAIYEALLNQTDLNFSNTQNKKKNKNSDQDKRKSIFGGKGRDRSKSKIVKEERKSKIDIIFNNSIPPPPPPPPPPPFSFPPPLMNQSITLLKPGVSNIKGKLFKEKIIFYNFNINALFNNVSFSLF